MQRILIVEDDAEELALISELLESEGFETAGCQDGVAGLAAAIRNPPDLVCLDIRMPRMDGDEVCRALRANEVTRGVPVLAITSVEESEARELMLPLGADDVLEKPVLPQVLVSRIREMIRPPAG